MVPKPNEEKEYFARQEVEERLAAEKKAELSAIQQTEAEAVASSLGISDLTLAGKLVELGFGRETVGIFSLLPLVYVAWADGEVSTAEHDQIMELASARGASEESDAYKFLDSMLSRRPSEKFLSTCLETLRAIYKALPTGEGENARQDLVSLSLSVANASGGFLGIFGNKVSAEEKALIDEIVAALHLDSDGTAQLLSSLDD